MITKIGLNIYTHGFDFILGKNALDNYKKETFVGKSKWVCYKASEFVEICVKEIKKNPKITHCGDKNCDRCNDMMLGGPSIKDDFFEK